MDVFTQDLIGQLVCKLSEWSHTLFV